MSKQRAKTQREKKQSLLHSAILSRKRNAVNEPEDIKGEYQVNNSSKRRQQAQNEVHRDLIGQEDSCSTSVIIGKSSSEPIRDGQRTPSDMLTSLTLSEFRGLTCMLTPEACSKRVSPLPHFSWADPQEVWELMVCKDAVYPRDPKMLHRHPALHARMRAILLDWLIEVCEVYRLHRETFYLAQDFVDRYLASRQNVPKQQLQLLGITALFVAAKIEEIYPPKLSEFAYVTDGACTETEILEKELVLLKLTDLCILDVGCLQFPYSVLAASALTHITSENLAVCVSGLTKCGISSCVQWMAAFAATLKENGQTKLFHHVTVDDMHSVQTHSVDLQLLEKAQARQPETNPFISQVNPQLVNEPLTPHQSSKKEPSRYESTL
ncbi:G1/S-specific cyclin-E-like [Limulus polyphemus]|uniref:G1/S-specific cyclin-E-like n=1 Tax=Limulus polyphemus TaxID=6850 RepID=A0ABM1TL03_LIMPO|nr:G1/S-specific cyclin-E-like [Limulus polyphemus]